jgi:hypothetical protein
VATFKKIARHSISIPLLRGDMTTTYPIKADSYFCRPILLKIAGNVHNGKNRIALFLFLYKMKDNEDIPV